MARGWHYAKLSLSNARRLSFPGMCILLFLFLSLCRFCLFVFFFCSRWSLVDVPLISFCPADHVPGWQPRNTVVPLASDESLWRMDTSRKMDIVHGVKTLPHLLID